MTDKKIPPEVESDDKDQDDLTQNEKLHETLSSLKQQLVDVEKNTILIAKILSERLSYDQTKESAFDRLYSELDALKRNAAFEEKKHLFVDLILFYDRLELYKGNDSSFDDIFDSLQNELKEILLRCSIEQIIVSGDSFEPSLQQIVGSHPVTDPEKDNQIVQIVRQGFVYKGAVIRPQEVLVGNYLIPSENISEDHTSS